MNFEPKVGNEYVVEKKRLIMNSRYFYQKCKIVNINFNYITFNYLI